MGHRDHTTTLSYTDKHTDRGCDHRSQRASSEHSAGAMTEISDSHITLTIQGARAQRGVSLSDFESFIDSFLAALRDYDRAGRGEPTRKSGHPDKRAEAVTAFRLVRFQTGSGIATIEPDQAAVQEAQLPVEDVPLSLATLRALVSDLAAEKSVPEPVVEALERACRSVGSDGTVVIQIGAGSDSPLVVDVELLNRVAVAGGKPADDEVRSVSGRLHLLDLEPDRLGIRAASGAEWSCRYPEELEERVKSLLDRIVWVEGSGKLTSPLRGSMTIERIEPVDDVGQSALFTFVPTDEGELLNRQGISAPQGLDTFSDPEWDDDSDDAYLAALLRK